LSLDHQVMLIFAGGRGYLDNVPVNMVRKWSQDFLRYMDTVHPEIGRPIRESGAWTDAIQADLKTAVEDFNASWSAS